MEGRRIAEVEEEKQSYDGSEEDTSFVRANKAQVLVIIRCLFGLLLFLLLLLLVTMTRIMSILGGNCALLY